MEMKKINKFILLIFFLLIILVFKAWFLLNPLSSGDWSFNFNESIRAFTLLPYSWNFNLNTGLGGASSFILPLSSYFLFTTSFLFSIFKIPWVLIERIVWFWPFLILSVSSSYFLFKKIFSNQLALLSSFVYLFNTYILMIVGGGQMGIAMAYSIVPLVLYLFIKLNENIKFKYSLLFGVLFGILIMFDLRIAYITLTAVAAYAALRIVNYVLSKEELRKKIFYILSFIFYIFIVPGIITFLLNSFWLLPTIVGRRNPIEEFGSAYASLEAVKFFSFAKLEDSISLLHPNWPENIFGKTGFLKPEFLLLPILAYASLFFINRLRSLEEKVYILFFALLGLLGAFLAKGANEPFGGVYLWLFDHFPGFIMFRDPTKWYTLVAISYSILIPFTIYKVYEWIKSQPKFQISNFKFQIKSKNQIFNLQNLFLLIIVFCLLFLIRPAIFGQLAGTFKATSVPNDYIKLEKFLSSQNSFSRTLWVPTQQRFGFYSNLHPAIPAQNLFKTVDYSQILKNLRMPEAEMFLQEAGVKYVIVPFDSQGEIFLKDRKYDKNIYQKTINEVKQIPYLKQVSGFGKIVVFEIPNPKDHFYISNQQSAISNQKITYQYVSPVEYRLDVKNAKRGDIIVFSESYDARWMARDSNTKFYDWPSLIGSDPYSRRFNSFTLRKPGDYGLIVYYYPQILVNLGMIISFSTLILVLAFTIFGSRLRKW